MKLRVFAFPDPPRYGGHKTQEAPKCQGLVSPSDGRRMVRRGSAGYAVIDWNEDDVRWPHGITRITPGQANDPQYQRQQTGEIVLLVPRDRHDPEPERRMAPRRDALALHLLPPKPDPKHDLTHYCRTGHARSLKVLAERPPAPDPIAAEARRAAGGGLATSAGWTLGHGGGRRNLAHTQATSAARGQ